MSNQNLIEILNLTKTYNKNKTNNVKAVDDVSLAVKDGEFLTILGPSGSGKTTLLNMIGGLDKPTAGKIVLDRTDITKLNENRLVNVR